MEQSVAQVLRRIVEGCLSLETSLGEKHSAMSISIEKKGSNNTLLPILNDYWWMKVKKKSKCLWTECPHGTGKRRWINTRYWTVRPYTTPQLPSRTKKPQNARKREKKTTTMAGNIVGRKKMAAAPVSRKKPNKKPMNKMLMQQLGQTVGKLVNPWCWSSLHSRWCWWICCPFFCWLGISEVWGRQAVAHCLPGNSSWFFSSQLFSLITDQIHTVQFTWIKELPKDCSCSLSKARERGKSQPPSCLSQQKNQAG